MPVRAARLFRVWAFVGMPAMFCGMKYTLQVILVIVKKTCMGAKAAAVLRGGTGEGDESATAIMEPARKEFQRGRVDEFFRGRIR